MKTMESLNFENLNLDLQLETICSIEPAVHHYASDDEYTGLTIITTQLV